jgi:cytochrome c-type protein NapC
MTTTGLMITVIIAIGVALAAVFAFRPSITATRGGKAVAFLSLFIFPLAIGLMGANRHVEKSKETSFCLSCHVMEPYGASLMADDRELVPAVHYQNHQVPPDRACFTCHTDYTLYGDFAAKMRGLRHVWVQYVTGPPEKIELYTPYNNRECLHCHAGARSFEEGVLHTLEDDTMEKIRTNQLSCLSSGCHEGGHAVQRLDEIPRWEREQ